MPSTLKIVLGALLILAPVCVNAAEMRGAKSEDCLSALSDLEQHDLGCPVDTAAVLAPIQ